MTKKFFTISMVLFLIVSAVGVVQGQSLQMAASFAIIADFVQEVGGDMVTVFSLVPAAADPHSWEPTVQEARFLAKADVLFVNGEGYEEWLSDLVASTANPSLTIVEVSEGLEALEGPSHSIHHDHHHDPHFWLSVPNAIHYVEKIAQTLMKADPQNAQYFRERADRYQVELQELDGWLLEQLTAIPVENRVLATYHNAFAYFADRYGFSAVEFLVSNPDREPTAKEMAAVIKSLRKLPKPVVFAEPQFSVGEKYVRTVAAEIGGDVRFLYSSTLTAEVPSYIELMRYNANVLLEALR